MKKALVTGANGFVGSHLTERLLAEGWDVRALVRRTSNLRWIKDLPVEIVYGDLVRNEGLDEAVKGVDVVFHVAGVVRALDQEGYVRGNYVSTRNIYLASEKAEVEKFIFLSSRAAVGPSPGKVRITEDAPIPPLSAYGKSKRLAEQFLQSRRTIPFVILRPVAVYGPRDYGIYEFFKLIKNHLNVYVGKGGYISMVHVFDVVDAAVAAVERGKSGEPYFLCGDRDLHIKEWGHFIAEVLDIKPLITLRIPAWIALSVSHVTYGFAKLIKKPTFLNPDKVRELSAPGWLCSNEKAKSHLGWWPQVDEADGFVSTFEWYIENGWL